MSEIIETNSPDAADIAVIADGLRAYNTAMAGYDDYRPLAVFVTDPGDRQGDWRPLWRELSRAAAELSASFCPRSCAATGLAAAS